MIHFENLKAVIQWIEMKTEDEFIECSKEGFFKTHLSLPTKIGESVAQEELDEICDLFEKVDLPFILINYMGEFITIPKKEE